MALIGDTLTITGTPRPESILIGVAGRGGMLRVVVDGKVVGRFGPVGRIAIDAGAGNDTVLVGPRVVAPAVIHGGPGNDHLQGGGGPDLVYGDDGDDVLVGSGGRDALVAGQGRNRVVVPRRMGAISVGPSASGVAMRLLSGAYSLKPTGARPAAGPIIVGTADLGDPAIVSRLTRALRGPRGGCHHERDRRRRRGHERPPRLPGWGRVAPG